MAEYRVILCKADTANDFGVGDTICEFENPKNLGYAKYINDIGEAFWTVHQRDVKVNVRQYEGTAHVFILRDGLVAWRGILAEHDANADDVILYAYGYEHILYHLLSKWNHTWTNVKIAGASGRPVDDLWSRATNLDGSQLGFATKGTVEAPVTTSDGSTDITLASYKLYFKRILFALKELVAIAVSDTTNVCYFELAYSTSATSHALTFNFWKDNGTDRDTTLAWGQNIAAFSDRYVPIFLRNDIKAVGTGAKDQLFRSSVETSAGTFGYSNFGRRMEPIYLSWVRDQSELDRVTKLRAAKAKREDVSIAIRALPDSFLPIGATGAVHTLGDRINVEIAHGITQIDKMMFVEGEQVIFSQGVEVVQPILSDRSGS